MRYNEEYNTPSMAKRVISVWYRHVRVYNSSFFSNAFPTFFEPLIFLMGMGIGIGGYIQRMGDISYMLFLASGLVVTSAMFTASFECTYGTFVRLEFDRIYDGMLGAPISSKDLIIGEILFAGSKGFFFSLSVLIVMWVTGVINYSFSIFAPLVGFLCGLMFSAFSMFITSIIKNMNHFNFYFTGFITPMFFFSGVVFPLENLPKAFSYVSEFIPLTHPVRLARALCVPGKFNVYLLFDLAYCLLFLALAGWLAIKGLKKRLIV